ncbi:TRAP transporter small permease [Lacrimispora sp. 210928-DFI.3.58]|uniref:TRAP transporter small permease n=1 Tax=Lacrimispora sp. 210928-DFI.3.58 TaxID=2883214 RepID=UPI0015B44A55|nr:TRAP transporter small permease [Lacrimispora sp. 210928-DFI.3.58]MCB7318895.1 TRAP transporter small permease [Lacrimispora sp. 210928-DFI.3.58]
MRLYKKITDVFVKIVSALLILLIAGIVTMMLTELCARNFFNKSFRFSTELCGFLFMWMAFLGVIVLYDQNRLITLDMIYVRVPEKVQNLFWFVNKIFSIGLGVIMIVAYCGMYKINSTSYFSTMQFLSKAWHFLPMAIAGGYIVVKSVYQLIERTMLLTGKAVQ